MWRTYAALYVTLASIILGFNFATPWFVLSINEEAVKNDRARDIVGWLKTLDRFYTRATESEFQSLIQEVNDSSNFKLNLFGVQEALIRYPLLESIESNNKLIFVDVETYELLYRLEGGQHILYVGPIQLVEEVGTLETLLDYLLLICLAVVVLGWHLSLWYKLIRLERAAEAIGQGDLGARAPQMPFLSLGNLNARFNDMAKKLEVLVNQSRDMGNIISHELRSPISRLKCELELYKVSFESQDRERYLNAFSDDVLELENLVNEFLLFSRMGYQANIERHPMRLKPLLTQLNQTWKREFKSDVRIDCDAAFIFSFEKTLLARALNNLVKNGFKYGRGVVEISARAELVEATRMVVIHVDDNGLGVAPEDKEHIFQPFKRKNDGYHDSGGFGLGLAITASIAKVYGGSIRLGSSPQGGARFTLMLTKE